MAEKKKKEKRKKQKLGAKTTAQIYVKVVKKESPSQVVTDAEVCITKKADCGTPNWVPVPSGYHNEPRQTGPKYRICARRIADRKVTRRTRKLTTSGIKVKIPCRHICK